MVKKIIFLLSVFVFFFYVPAVVIASIGVGVGTGKIDVTEKLRSGIVYKIPSVTVINTGDQPANYSIDIAYNESQTEIKPDAKWFSFSPTSFRLEPNQAQPVQITLTLPLKTIPGKYFAYIEGFPVNDAKSGTTVGVAAASKLYFEVVPSNFISGVYYRLVSLIELYSPWPERFAILMILIAVLLSAKKYLNVEIKLKKDK